MPAPPLHRVRQLSYSALALFERCSYRYYAERVAGLRERRGGVVAVGRRPDARPRSATPCTACSRRPTCASASCPTSGRCGLVPGRDRRGARPDRRARHGLLRVRAGAARRLARRRPARGAVRLRARRRAASRPARHPPPRRRARADRRLQDERARRPLAGRDRLGGLHAPAARLRPRVPPRRRRGGRGGVRVPRAARGGRERDLHGRRSAPRSRPSSRPRSSGSTQGEFVPTPGEFTCSGCPALDLVCAGPRNRSAARRPEAFVGADAARELHCI